MLLCLCTFYVMMFIVVAFSAGLRCIRAALTICKTVINVCGFLKIYRRNIYIVVVKFVINYFWLNKDHYTINIEMFDFEGAIEKYKKKLLDLTRRNQLINFKNYNSIIIIIIILIYFYNYNRASNDSTLYFIFMNDILYLLKAKCV